MATHYALYENMSQVVPWNAKYSYPTQANRATKSNIKIPPKNGAVFASNGSRVIRLELPATGYCNPQETFLEFDAAIHTTNPTTHSAYFQNGIASIFRTVSWSYGSLTGEVIQDYNILTRTLAEATMTNSNIYPDQTSVSEGYGGLAVLPTESGGAAARFVNERQHLQISVGSTIEGDQPLRTSYIRRYRIPLGLGLFQQHKLLPLKWMASQISISLELADFADCVMSHTANHPTSHYEVSNVNLCLSLLEFDGSYDQGFYQGLTKGIPIKFNSWNRYTMSVAPGTSQNLLIPERNRSLKCALVVMLPPPRVHGGTLSTIDPDGTNHVGGCYPYDSHATVQSSPDPSNTAWEASCAWEGHVVDFQWRIGGKYYPAQSVRCANVQGANGAAEAYDELAKALNTTNDMRLSTGTNGYRWSDVFIDGTGQQKNLNRCADWYPNTSANHVNAGPSAFVIAADFESSRGGEVSGLNGEEQNDLALSINYSHPQNSNFLFKVFVFYDNLLILRENNLVELIK